MCDVLYSILGFLRSNFLGCKGWVLGGLCTGHSSLELARQAETLVSQTWQGGATGRSTDRISLEQGASSYKALWPGVHSPGMEAGGWPV